MDVIYVDVLFARNALLDFVLLLSAARLAGRVPHWGRLALAAALGGVYAAAAAVPPLRWLAGPVWAVPASLLMAFAAYGPPPGLWRVWGCFLALSAGFAGAVYALGELTGQAGAPFFTAPPRLLLLSFGGGYAAVRFFLARLRRQGEVRVLPAEITLLGRSVCLPALRDTGNALVDPLSGAGVLITDAASLAPLFSPEVLATLPEDAAGRFRRLSELPELRGRLRLLPFSAVGTKRDLLLCFRPDRLSIGGEETDLLVALSPTPVANGEYAAVY